MALFLNKMAVRNGERMHFTLGSHLRRMYPNILTNTTTHKEIEVLSSSTPMCQTSAQSHMMGMYPSSPYNKIENGFTHLKDPAYININVTRLAGDDALPYGQKPFYMKMESKSEDFLFLPDIVQGCPKLASTI